MEIFFSVGEPSGDIHGANLIRDMRSRNPNVRCSGLGGTRMERAGCELMYDLASMAVMGIIPVLKQIRFFFQLLAQVDAHFSSHRIDAVILIDFPGFNWWVARKAKKHGIPVFYYGVPQMWGWAPWRIKKMRRLVDHALCKLPFEEEWYGRRGCQAKYVGHPFFDEVSRQKIDKAFINEYDDEGPLVLLLPGSRTQEINVHIAPMLDVTQRIERSHPKVRFAIGCINEKHARVARRLVGQKGLKIDVFVGRTPELIRLSTACVACSGSVSLELMANQKPTVILYQITRPSFMMQLLLRRAKYITLVNLLAASSVEREQWATYDPDLSDSEPVPYPEYLTCQDRSRDIAAQITNWLDEPAQREHTVQWLKELNDKYGEAGASQNAAEYILSTLSDLRGISFDAASQAQDRHSVVTRRAA